MENNEPSTSESILQLRTTLFNSVAERNQADSSILDDYKDQVTHLRTSFQQRKQENDNALLFASQKIKQLENGLAAASTASELAASVSDENAYELRTRVDFYQSSLIEANAQYETLYSSSGLNIAKIQAQAEEKVYKARAEANETKEKYVSNLMNTKVEARKRQIDADQVFRAKEMDLKQQYYKQARDISSQRIRDVHDRDRERDRKQENKKSDATSTTPTTYNINTTLPTNYPFVSTPGNNTNIGGSMEFKNSVSRLTNVAAARNEARVQEEMFDLTSKLENSDQVKHELQKEIQRLQDDLLTASHTLRGMETVKRDLDTERSITQQLKDRIIQVEDDNRSTSELRSSLATEIRKNNTLESAVEFAEANAKVEHGKGYEEGLIAMGTEVETLQKQIHGNRDRVAKEYEKVVDTLRGQRDDFEAQLRGLEQDTRQKPENSRTGSELVRALENANGVVEEVREQSKLSEEKRVWEKRLKEVTERERQREIEVDEMRERGKRKEDEDRRERERWSRQMEEKDKDLRESERIRDTTTRQLMELQEINKQKRTTMEDTQNQQKQHHIQNVSVAGISPPPSPDSTSLPLPLPPQSQQFQQQQFQQEQFQQQQYQQQQQQQQQQYQQQHTETAQLDDLRRALVATRRELDDLHASMDDAKQHISDLTWQNTSLRHDAFMERSGSKFKTTSETHPHLASPNLTNNRPTTLDEYHANTRTLSQVLSNTKPIRLNLDRSTNAHKRRSAHETHETHLSLSRNSSRGITGFGSGMISGIRSSRSSRRKENGTKTNNNNNIMTPRQKLYQSDLMSSSQMSQQQHQNTPASPSFVDDVDVGGFLSQKLNPMKFTDRQNLEGPI